MHEMTAARSGLRVLLCPKTGPELPQTPPEFLPELTALIAVSCGRLVARQFSNPTDRRIGAFVAEAAHAADWPPTLSPESIGRLIRWMLGDAAQLREIPADQITPGQLYLLVRLAEQQKLGAAGLERLLESAEPLAGALVEYDRRERTETPQRVRLPEQPWIQQTAPESRHPDSGPRDASDRPSECPASLSVMPVPAQSTSAPPNPRPRARQWRWVAGGAVIALATLALIVSLLGGNESPFDELTGEPSKPENFLKVYTPEYPVGLRGPTLAKRVGTFVGPHFAVRIAQVNITDSVHVGLAHLLGEDEAFSAAEGHEFVLFNVADDPTLEAPWGEGQVDVALVVDGAERPLDDLPVFGETVVASVPDGAPVLLEVTDSDRAIQFDLRAGQVVSGEETYLSASGSLPDTLYRASAAVAYGGRRQRLRVELFSMGGTVNLVSHHPEFGWAKSGRAWLVVGPFKGRSTPSEVNPTYGYFDVAFDMDVRQSLRLKVPGEGSLRPVRTWPRHAKMHELASPSEIVALFDVPASFREGELVVTPQGATAVDTSSPASAFDLRPHRDCGVPDVACLPWSDAPPTESVELSVSP